MLMKESSSYFEAVWSTVELLMLSIQVLPRDHGQILLLKSIFKGSYESSFSSFASYLSCARVHNQVHDFMYMLGVSEYQMDSLKDQTHSCSTNIILALVFELLPNIHSCMLMYDIYALLLSSVVPRDIWGKTN